MDWENEGTDIPKEDWEHPFSSLSVITYNELNLENEEFFRMIRYAKGLEENM